MNVTDTDTDRSVKVIILDVECSSLTSNIIFIMSAVIMDMYGLRIVLICSNELHIYSLY